MVAELLCPAASFVDVVVPLAMEEIAEAMELISQERNRQRALQEIMGVLVPLIQEQSVVVDFEGVQTMTMTTRLAQKEHSAPLPQVTSRLSTVKELGANACQDPFPSVKGLITDTNSRLQPADSLEDIHVSGCRTGCRSAQDLKPRPNLAVYSGSDSRCS